MEDWKEDLLLALLECGSLDLDRLQDILRIAKKFGIDIYYILDYAEETFGENGERPKYNEVMYCAMRAILEAIADIIEEEDPDIAEKLRDWDVYTNYTDSWFNLDSLDRDPGEIEKLSIQEIAKAVKKEVKKKIKEGAVD